MKNLKGHTQVNYSNVINKYIDPAIRKYQCKSIRPASLQKNNE
ncbi:tyrosine-type recombinase/integrase [Levilactobacillus huananensis]